MGGQKNRDRELPGRGVLLLVALCCLSILLAGAAPRKMRLIRAATLAEENGSPAEDKGKQSENDSPSVRQEGQRLRPRDRLARAEVVARQARPRSSRPNQGLRLSSEHDLRNGLGTPLRL
jgi:hypothetical protein